MDRKALLELTGDIASSYAGQNQLSPEELIETIKRISQTLSDIAGEKPPDVQAGEQEIKPAMPVNKAFGSDKVYCLVCGQPFTTLKKHLMIAHNMSPKEYRKAFGIPSKTPLVARKYSEAKKKIAQDKGLAEKLAAGREKRKQASKASAESSGGAADE